MSQLKELNRNIAGKNRKIKSTYRSMQRVRVYFVVDIIQTSDNCPIATSVEFKTAEAAEKLFAFVSISDGYTYQIRRIQTSGYVGGIILGGSSEVIKKTVSERS